LKGKPRRLSFLLCDTFPSDHAKQDPNKNGPNAL